MQTRIGLALSFAPLVLAISGCTGTVLQPNAGTATDAGPGSSDTGAAANVTDGGSGSRETGAGDSDTGAAGDDAGTCHGDQATWTSLTTMGAIPCTKNSDCCVVVNGCLSQAQIVSASNESAAKAAWPYCDSQCNNCIPPPVQVFCTNAGVCGGTLVDPSDTQDSDAYYFNDHCGIDGPAGSSADKLNFTCGGG